MSPERKEIAEKKSYRTLIEEELKGSRLWDYLSYDKEGNLWVNDTEFTEIATQRTPLEVVETRIIERRAREWRGLAQRVAERVGYRGGTDFFYATKADPAAEVVASAMKAGWNIEFSSQIDALSINWLKTNNLLPKGIKVVCNGLKVNPSSLNRPTRNNFYQNGVRYEGATKASARFHEESYAKIISSLKARGLDITPVIDSESELDFWGQPGEVPQEGIDVGVRFKLYGVARTDEEELRLQARHGMDWETIQRVSERIAKMKHLTLTTFHAMVGAAEVIPVDDFVDTLLYASTKFFELKKNHPSLKYFNMGGGMPPFATPYNHELFLEKLFTGLKKLAKKYGEEEPVMVFEFGSLVASEGGFHLMKVLERKVNSVDAEGKPEEWLIVDLPLMRAIPDMLIIGKDDFIVLAANHADKPAKEVTLGDLTCDSDGRWPTKAMKRKILVPDVDPISEEQYLVIVSSKAYGEALTGVEGVGHSGQIEPGEVIIFNGADGTTRRRVVERQTARKAMGILGYEDENREMLSSILKKG